MSVKVLLPNAFQKHTDGAKEISSTAHNLPELITEIETTFPALRPHLRDEQGMALGLQRGEREGGIMRGQLRAVMEPGLRPHRKTVGELVGRNLHRLGREAVQRVRFVAGPRHQRREGQVHALRAFTLQDEGIERIEGLIRLIVGFRRGNRREYPAFRRGWIDVVEMMKVGRIFQIAEHR